MCANLIKAGHEVTVFDVSKAAVDEATAAGATSASSPAELASQVNTVVTMLPSNPHVKSVYMGEDGILSSIQQGTLCIDASTIDPNVAREVSEATQAAGARLVDAPVSGGTPGAAAATLTFMVGGSDKDFNEAQPLLANMGKNIVHCGDVGNGQVAKVCNNLVLAISMIGVSEAMNLGTRLGADPKVLAGIFNTSSARCWSSDTYNPYPGVMEGVPSSRGYSGGFGSNLMLKDLGLALDAASTSQTPMPLTAASAQVYSQLRTLGYGGHDFSVVLEFLRGTSPDKLAKLDK